MRRVMLLLIAVAMGAMPAAAQSKNPYTKLFETRETLKQAAARAALNSAEKFWTSKGKIVCGMTVIEAPPFFDQKMKVHPPKDRNVRYTIRTLDPAICDNGK